MKTRVCVAALAVPLSLAGCAPIGPARSGAGWGGPLAIPFALDDNQQKEVDACLSGQTTAPWMDNNGETPGLQCSRVGQLAAFEGFPAVAREYYIRGCETYSDGDSCGHLGELIGPRFSVNETLQGDKVVDTVEWSDESLDHTIDATTLQRVRDVLTPKCKHGIVSYANVDQTGWVCSSLGGSFLRTEPKNAALALEYLSDACAVGEAASCGPARLLGADISLAQENGAEARAHQSREQTQDEFARQQAQGRAESRRIEQEKADQDAALRQSAVDGINAAFGQNYGNGAGASPPTQPGSPGGPPTTNPATPQSPPGSSAGSKGPGEACLDDRECASGACNRCATGAAMCFCN